MAENNTNPQDANIIVLTDDLGNEVEFEYLDTVEYNDCEYIVLMENVEDTDEAVILKIENVDDENESYVGVDNDEIIDAVFEIFKERFKN